MEYAKIKKWFEENKPKIIIGVCYVLVFMVGFGAGKFDKNAQSSKSKQQINYTSNSKALPEAQPAAEAAAQSPKAQVLSASSTAPGTKTCLIKGNISSTGSKIYHMPGGAFYDRTNPEQCFNTEAEAQAAGFRKSSR